MSNDLFFARHEARFYTAAVNSRGVWSYQIDGTITKRYSLVVFYLNPGDAGEVLGQFDRVQDAERAAKEHYQGRAL
jgi:hypothetical protein